MKKLLLSLLTLVSFASFAQSDAEVTLLLPETGAEVNSGRPFLVGFSVKNVGNDTIFDTDTMIIGFLLGNQILQGATGLATDTIAPGDSIVYARQIGITFTQDVASIPFCVVVAFNDTTVDPVSTNNADCISIKLQQIATSVKEANELAASVLAYPNPASTSFTITMKSTEASVDIMDITGRTIETTPVVMGEAKFDVSTYNNGVYFYQVKDASSNLVKSGKFTVSH